MQKSSKKSSKQSPSQAEEFVEELRADPTAGVQPSHAGPSSIHSMPGKTVKKAFKLAIPFGFGFKLTIEWRVFQIFILAIGFYLWAAVTANDFLYLLAAGYFIALALGIVLPLLQVLDIKAECSLPEQLIVSEWVNMRVKLSRMFILGPLSIFMPIRSLRVTANLSRRIVGGKGAELILDPDPLLVSSLNEPSWLTLPTPKLRRGIYFVEQVQLESSFPLGLFWWSRNVKLVYGEDREPMKVTVHPLVLPLSGSFLFQLLALRSTMGLSNSTSIIVPQSSSVRSVREFRPGDSIRHVHWPSSARQSKILVREFDSEQLPVFDLLLDLRASWKNQEQFEVAVCLIHSLMHMGHRLGIMPNLILNPPFRTQVVQKNLMFDLPQMPYGLEYVAELLARVEPVPSSIDNLPEPEPSDEEQESDNVTYSANNIRPLLTIIPMMEMKAKFSPSRGDHLVAPIDFAIIPRNWQDEEPETKTTRGRGGPKGHSPVGRPTNSKTIATIDAEDEFVSL
jgi:hypothetical protein